MKIITFLKNNYLYLFILTVLLVITIINIQPGRYIMGLDSITPYFGSEAIIDKITGNNTSLFFSYFPISLLLPIFSFLQKISIPFWVINQAFIFFCLWFGVLGAGIMTTHLTSNPNNDSDFEKQKLFFFGSLLYLTNLCTIWIFNQPNFFFLSAFASIPWIIVLIVKANLKTRINYIYFVPFFISLILFLQTTINLVTTITYLTAVVLISLWILRRNIKLRQFTIPVTRDIVLITIGILFILQIILIFLGSNEFVISKLVQHYNSIQSNGLTTQITQDLQASSILRNTFINNILFRNSWIETHNSVDGLLFQNLAFYQSYIITFIGLLPFIGSILALILATNSERRNIFKLNLVIILGLLLMSSLAIKLFQETPILREVLRWSGSKFWPFTILPIVLITSNFLAKSKIKVITIFMFLAISLIYIFPIFQGKLFSKTLITKLPEQYLSIDSHIVKGEKYYYLPTPESLYFYQYKFGYFGSDFLSYMTKGDGQTSGVISYFSHSKDYSRLINSLNKCEQSFYVKNIIWDENLLNSESQIQIINCLRNNYTEVANLNGIILYEKK